LKYRRGDSVPRDTNRYADNRQALYAVLRWKLQKNPNGYHHKVHGYEAIPGFQYFNLSATTPKLRI
jgi:hypothetical protein